MSDSVILVNDPFAPAITGGNAFAGLPAATLQSYLVASQNALQQLLTGAKTVTVSYGEGTGQKSVSYQRTDETKLRLHIKELQQLLGIGGGRRAIRPRY